MGWMVAGCLAVVAVLARAVSAEPSRDVALRQESWRRGW